MLTLTMPILLALSVPATPRLVSSQERLVCLHEAAETHANKMRRLAALRLAQTINNLQARSWSERRSFQPLAALPADAVVTPDGFELEVTTDGSAYAVSIKDTLDECGYAVMSDQDGVIYNAVPFRVR
jgi:hypothetical protein